MNDAPFSRVVPHNAWLAQGDLFRTAPVLRAGVREGMASSDLDRGPALLLSHGCAIDKKTGDGRSELEHLSFLPLQSVQKLPEDRAQKLRQAKNTLGPFNAIYIGEVPEVGESYAMLTQPYTLPAVMLAPTLKHFDASETGEEADTRIVPTMGDTRVGRLTQEAMKLLYRKWIVQWTRFKVEKDQLDEMLGNA